MHSAIQAIQKLTTLGKRYKKLKEIFNTFQKDIDKLTKTDFPAKGIKIKHESDTISRINFLDSDTKITFSLAWKDGASKGKLSFLRINQLDDQDITEIKHILFNGDGEVHIKPPDGEDAINIHEDNCSINIVLNWLCEELEILEST